MSALGRFWARLKLLFIVAAPPPRLPPPEPPAAEDMDTESKFGPYQKLEAKESTHVVGMRNPKMTGRTSATHPPRKGVQLTQVITPAMEARRQFEELPDRDAHRRELHEGPPMLECFRCGELFPAEDMADHPCEGKHAPDRMLGRSQGGGSASFDTALDNVVYLDPKLEAGRKK